MQRLLIIGTTVSAIIIAALLMWGPSISFTVKLRLAPYFGDTYALYMDNGQMFYGKIASVSWSTIVLRDVLTFQNLSVGQGQTTNSLTKQTANPLTKPKNFLAINRDHILFLEELGPTASVLQVTSQ